jgi:molybdenum cofactor cytidylyltransferase
MSYCKLEAQIEGVPIVQRVLEAALNSDLNRVILVTGTKNLACIDIQRRDSSRSKFYEVKNLNPKRGMASSMRKGLKAVQAGAQGAMVILGDQPGISTEIINQLLDAFSYNPSSIVVPFVSGRRTTPVIFPSAVFPELAQIEGDVGGREVLTRHPEMICAVELGSCYDDTDVDTPEDLNRFRQNCAQKIRSTE